MSAALSDSMERAVRYRTFVNEAAKQLGVKPSSELAKHVGALRFARQTFADRMVSGRDVDPTVLIKLDEVSKAYLPQATSAPPPATEPPFSLQICSRKPRTVSLCGTPTFTR